MLLEDSLDWEVEELPPLEHGQYQGKAQKQRGAPADQMIVFHVCFLSFLKNLDLRDGARPLTPWRKRLEAGRKTRPGILSQPFLYHTPRTRGSGTAFPGKSFG